MDTIYLTVPGVMNSSPQHWQSLWEKEFPEQFRRIEQKNWDTPTCADWIEKIERGVQVANPATIVLVAHSLGCTSVAHWARKFGTKIKGALLVAPSDCEAETYNFDTKGFAPIPLEKLPFNSLVAASDNDEYVSLKRAEEFAEKWGSELINVGAKGHINHASGFGEWNEGLKLLKRLD